MFTYENNCFLLIFIVDEIFAWKLFYETSNRTNPFFDEDVHRNTLTACADQLLSDSIDKSTLSSVWYIHEDDRKDTSRK